MERKGWIASALCSALFMSLTIPANAALVRASFFGTTQSAAAGNAYGLDAGDFVFGFAIFDTDWLTNPFPPPDDIVYVINHNADPSYQLSLSIGNRSFTESENASWPNNPFFPTLGFTDIGSLDGLESSFLGVAMTTCDTPAEPGCSSQDGLGFGGFAMDWAIYENGMEVAAGVWDLNSIKIQPVPVPAALPLLLGAIISLAGFARRR